MDLSKDGKQKNKQVCGGQGSPCSQLACTYLLLGVHPCTGVGVYTLSLLLLLDLAFVTFDFPEASPGAPTVQVSVYGRSRLGQDVFLGEVLIPLREVEETGASGIAEVHKYILGRRSTKERVSGEIALACSWRVTPLDVVIMKVKAHCKRSSFGTHFT